MPWKIVPDMRILMSWECPECGDEAEVYPTFYEEAGEPCCGECGEDMMYMYTRVQVDEEK